MTEENKKTNQEIILSEINSLKELFENILEELKEIADKKEEVVETNGKIKRWRAYLCERYYALLDGDIINASESDDDVDNDRYAIGNYFKTVKEAEHIFEMLKLKQQLKDLALRLNNGEKIDWQNFNQQKYCISLDNETTYVPLVQYSTFDIKHLGNIYCLSENFLKVALEEIGKEKLIKLIKSGV